MPGCDRQGGRKSRQRPQRQAGAVLIAVVIALVFASAVAAAMYQLAADSRAATVGPSAQAELETFAHGVLAICDDIVNDALDEVPSEPNLNLPAGYVVTYANPVTAELAAPLTLPVGGPTPWWSDHDPFTQANRGNIVIAYNDKSATLDLDYLARQDQGRLQSECPNPPCGPLGVVEFGKQGAPALAGANEDSSDPQQLLLGTYRCNVVATDSRGRTTRVYGFVRKYRTI